MDDNKLILNGFVFSTQELYLQAKKEMESIAFLKKHTDFSKPKIALKAYNKLIETDTFQSVIGYCFLLELKRTVLMNDMEDNNKLLHIPIKGKIKEINYSSYLKSQQEKDLNHYKSLYNNMRLSRRNSRIVNLFLVIIVIILFLIPIYFKNNDYKQFEKNVVDKNAKWSEELQQKEEELNQREDALDNQENQK